MKYQILTIKTYCVLMSARNSTLHNKPRDSRASIRIIMSDSADVVVSVDLQGKECSEPTVLHLMPCEVNASGVSKAKVDCYFTSTMKEDGPNSESE